MSKLRKEFSEKDWKNCCGSHCGGCSVYSAYREEYGKKKGKSKFDKDRKKLELPVKS